MRREVVPPDLTKIQSKALMNLTKRQLVCFGLAAVVGVPMYFVSRGFLGNSSAMMLVILVAMPFFVAALYEKNGLPMEKYLLLVWRYMHRSRQRPYRTENLYAQLEAQAKLYKEVRRIVRSSHTKGKESDRVQGRTGKRAGAAVTAQSGRSKKGKRGHSKIQRNK